MYEPKKIDVVNLGQCYAIWIHVIHIPESLDNHNISSENIMIEKEKLLIFYWTPGLLFIEKWEYVVSLFACFTL